MEGSAPDSPRTGLGDRLAMAASEIGLKLPNGVEQLRQTAARCLLKDSWDGEMLLLRSGDLLLIGVVANTECFDHLSTHAYDLVEFWDGFEARGRQRGEL